MMGYGERLRKLREASGMTQAELADTIHVSRPLIAQYEIGCKIPSVKTAERIADTFGVSIDFMVKGKKRDGEKE